MEGRVGEEAVLDSTVIFNDKALISCCNSECRVENINLQYVELSLEVIKNYYEVLRVFTMVGIWYSWFLAIYLFRFEAVDFL